MKTRAITLLLLSACGFNFDSPSEVKDLRVLGLRSDPPELTATAPITFVQLDALVAGADPSTEVDYAWSACAVLPVMGSFFGGSSVARCPEDAGTTIAVKSGRARLDMLQATMPVPREIVSVLASGAEGLSLQLQAQLQVDDLFAVKRIAVTPSLPDLQQPNANPQLVGLDFADAGWSAAAPLSIAYDACPAEERAMEMMKATVCRHEILPLYDETAKQKYQGESLSGVVEEQTELLSFTWLASAGSIELGQTQEPNPDFQIGQRTKVSTFWREPKEKPSGPVTFWVVVRDGRGGESWTSRQLVFP